MNLVLPERLQLAVIDSAREREHVADVGDASEIHDAALEAQTEACVAGRAVLAQVQICLLYTSPSPRDTR